MGVSLNVQVVSAGQVIGQHQFDGDTHRNIKIGRLPSAQIKLEDPKASRIHAVIEFSGADVSLIDMGSTGGTSVNGARVQNKIKLNHGDRVAIGDTQLVVAFGVAAATVGVSVAAATAAPGAPLGSAPFSTPSTPWAPVGGFSGVAAPVAFQASADPSAAVRQPGGAYPAQPHFDPGNAVAGPIKRITGQRLGGAAVESKPHPSLPPEQQLSADNRVLEMRVYWGEILLNVFHYLKPKQVTIGETRRTNVFISSEGLPTEEFPLIRYHGNDYVLTFHEQMEGELETGGVARSLGEVRGSSLARKDGGLDGSYQVRLPLDSRVLVHWGSVTFALRFVPPSHKLSTSFFKNLDLAYLNVFFSTLFAAVAILITLLVYPYDTESLRDDLFDKPDRWAALILEAPKETKSTKDMLEKIKASVEKKKEELKPPPDKNEIKVAKQVMTEQPRPQKTKQQKQAEVKQKFTQLLAGMGGGGSSGSILGGGGGGSLSGTLSNVIGTTGVGSATAGLAGLGIRGGGPLTGGGVGTSRGIAGIGTAGRLGGGGLGYGSGVGMGKRKDTGLTVLTPVVMGALPMEVIRKVIDENKSQIRYCYERELQRNQNLEGKVSLRWIIGATGDVVKVQVMDSTLKNEGVEQCIAGKIKMWKFPAPAGGGIVEVKYPFVLKAS